MGFSRQEYWIQLPFPSPGDLPDSEIEPVSLASPVFQVGSLQLSHQGSSGKDGEATYERLPEKAQ